MVFFISYYSFKRFLGCSISVCLLWLSALQESAGWRECVCGGAGQPGGFSWLLAAVAWLLQGHLGLPVLPSHRQLPVLLIEGELRHSKSHANTL